MTESHWLSCEDVDPLIEFAARISTRKLRLFAAACCRRIWKLSSPLAWKCGEMSSACATALETAERFADGHSTPTEVDTAYREVAALAESAQGEFHWLDQKLGDSSTGEEVEEAYRLWQTAKATRDACGDISPTSVASCTMAMACAIVGHEFSTGPQPLSYADYANRRHTAELDEQARCIPILREIFGNPFRAVTLDSAWLTWQDATVPELAQAAYHERELPSGHLDAGRLAILADALEEAGSTNADILGHLRGSGPHVRGCWVVDLLLGND